MPTRRLIMQKLYNARDLGGFPTADGKTTRFGVFIRSEAPVDITEDDLATLKAYGVTASMDFRSTHETELRPSDLQNVMPYFHRPLFNEAASAGGMKQPPPMKAPVSWGEQYIAMAEESRAWAVDVLTIAAENEGALLYHCTTGKDRTGIMTMYLLDIAGVPRADIAADYCVSQVFLEPVYKVLFSGAGPMNDGHAPKMDESFFKTKPESILRVYDYLTEKYGGVTAYLHEIGVPQQVLQAIREKLTEN